MKTNNFYFKRISFPCFNAAYLTRMAICPPPVWRKSVTTSRLITSVENEWGLLSIGMELLAVKKRHFASAARNGQSPLVLCKTNFIRYTSPNLVMLQLTFSSKNSIMSVFR